MAEKNLVISRTYSISEADLPKKITSSCGKIKMNIDDLSPDEIAEVAKEMGRQMIERAAKKNNV